MRVTDGIVYRFLGIIYWCEFRGRNFPKGGVVVVLTWEHGRFLIGFWSTPVTSLLVGVRGWLAPPAAGNLTKSGLNELNGNHLN